MCHTLSTAMLRREAIRAYNSLDILGCWYTCVNFGVRNFRSPTFASVQLDREAFATGLPNLKQKRLFVTGDLSAAAEREGNIKVLWTFT